MIPRSIYRRLCASAVFHPYCARGSGNNSSRLPQMPESIHIQFNVNQFWLNHSQVQVQIRTYCQVTTSEVDKKLNPNAADKKKLGWKTPKVETILLISEADNLSECTLLEAEKIAKKKGLQLVKVDDTKGKLHTEKKVYRLLSNSQYFGDDWKIRKKKGEDGESSKENKPKEDKSLVIKSKITEHDLMSKLKNIKKLVEKGHTVRIFIEAASGSTMSAAETIYTSMEENLKESARFVQKRVKGSEIRVQIMSLKGDEKSQEKEKGQPSSASGNAKKEKVKSVSENVES